MIFPGFTAETGLYRSTLPYCGTATNRSLTAIAACVGSIFVNSETLALRPTTESCLEKGLCAYVSPHGRVTCGPCPGQARAADVRAIAEFW
jgi:hypothetical protein